MRHKYGNAVAFNDFLFNVLLLFVFLFVVAVLLMNPPTKKADIPAKAEFMVVLEWDEDSSADVDLWIQRDENDPVGYKNKESAVLHLERDDLGHSTDTVVINGVSKIVAMNREVITVRGVVPGEYYVGIHYYRNGDDSEKERSKKFPTRVTGTVTFIDVNPYKEIWSTQFMMDTEGTKINLYAVSVNESGNVEAIYNHNKNLGPEIENSSWPVAGASY